jgi:hypothetical protein
MRPHSREASVQHRTANQRSEDTRVHARFLWLAEREAAQAATWWRAGSIRATQRILCGALPAGEQPAWPGTLHTIGLAD